jgi:hypothetical protein
LIPDWSFFRKRGSGQSKKYIAKGVIKCQILQHRTITKMIVTLITGKPPAQKIITRLRDGKNRTADQQEESNATNVRANRSY